VPAEHIAHAGRRHGHAELAALAHYAEVAPAGVLPGQAQDKGDDFMIEGVGCGPAMARVGPGPRDELAVPAQQGRGRDEEG
jgi:hypothetical protein